MASKRQLELMDQLGKLDAYLSDARARLDAQASRRAPLGAGGRGGLGRRLADARTRPRPRAGATRYRRCRAE
jgi:hypothetical protein